MVSEDFEIQVGESLNLGLKDLFGRANEKNEKLI